MKASGRFSVLGQKEKKSRRKRRINGQSCEYDIQLQTEGRDGVLLQVRGCRGDFWSPRSIWIGAWRLCFKRNTKCSNVLFRLKICSFQCCRIVFTNTWGTLQHTKKWQFGTKGHTSRVMHKPGVIMRNGVCALPQGEDLNENGGGSRGNFPLSAVPSFAKPASFTSRGLQGCLCFQTMEYSERRQTTRRTQRDTDNTGRETCWGEKNPRHLRKTE